MATYDDKLKDLLWIASEAVSRANNWDGGGADPESVVRIREVLAYAQLVINGADSALVVQGAIGSLEATLAQFLDNPLQAAESEGWFERCIDQLARFPQTLVPGRSFEQAAKDGDEERLLLPATEANVDALLEAVRLLLDEEDSRDQSFNTRGVGLAGFVGIVISLSATLGREALSATWGTPWKGISVALFAAVLLFLIASVTAVLQSVLQPREAASLSMRDIERFALPEYVYRAKVINQGIIMRGLIEALAIERSRAGRKASGLRWGYRLLLAGLISISILGFLVGLHDAKLIGVHHGRTKHKSGHTYVPRRVKHRVRKRSAAAARRIVAVSHADG